MRSARIGQRVPPRSRWTLIALAWPGLLSLCPGLSASGQVYMTREEALKRAFPRASSFLEMRHILSRKERALLSKKLRRRLPEKGYLSYLALDGKGEPMGLAVLTAEIGKVEPFFLLLALDLAGAVVDIEILEYREPRGSEIRQTSYLKRFRSIDLDNLRKRLRRIPVIPGATLSCHAVGRAVRKALVLRELYLRQSPGGRTGERLRARFRKGGARVLVTSPPRSGRAPPGPAPGGRRTLGLPLMGEVFRVELAHPVPEEELRGVFPVAQRLEEALSPLRPGSLTARANLLDLGQALDLSAWPELQAPLASAFEAASRTGGRFSPVPSRSDPRKAFRLEAGNRRIRRVGRGNLDPGAFGKGLAADRVAALCEARGLPWMLVGFRSSFCLRLGGGRMLGLATSGSSLRGGHILDPRTRRSLWRKGRFGALAKTALQAEFLSTAFFVEGRGT